jgi:hypothetical protein
MKQLLPVIVLLLLAVGAGADSWYSIDGFTVETDESIRIQAENAGTEIIGFLLDGGKEPDVAGWLAESGGGPLPDKDMVILGALSIVRSIGTDPDDVMQTIEISPYTSPRGINGQWMTVYSTSGYHDAYVIRLETPGGIFDSMILVPQLGGGEGRAQLDALLESLEVTMEEAAG